VWKRRQVGEDEYRVEVYFYGLGGERLGTYEAVRNGATLTFETVADNLYFGGRLIRSGREVVAVDRLGSVRWRRNLDTGATAQFDYWPYGQEKPSATAQEREKFGTYYRDATGLDYADQRYYASTSGRFLTADPSMPGDPAEPQSFNLYAYVLGDPVNYSDPEGLDPINLPSLVPTDRAQCISMFLPALQTLGVSVNEYFNSSVGLLGLTMFFEFQASFPSGAVDLERVDAWGGIGWTIWNRFGLSGSKRSAFYGVRAPVTFAETIWAWLFWNDAQLMSNE
jgi:RHS repeat-associated protein